MKLFVAVVVGLIAYMFGCALLLLADIPLTYWVTLPLATYCGLLATVLSLEGDD